MLRLFLALGMLLTWAVASGQYVAFAELTIPDIEGAQVTAMALDEHDALWLGTDQGLHRFDGAATEHYVSDPADPSSLPDDLVRDVRMDVGGILWVSTVSGAWHIDTRTGQHGLGRFDTPEGVHGNVECLATASDEKGGIWAFCNRSGVFLRAAGDSLFRKMTDAAVEGAAGGVMAADGGLWFSDRSTIKRLDPSSGGITSFPVLLNGQAPPPKALLLAVKADPEDPGMLWCSTWGMGILRFDTRTHRWSAPAIAKLPMSDLWNVVHAHAPVGGGRCYVAMDDRLWVVDAERMVAERMTVGVGPERSVRAVFVDGDRLFVGALGEVWTTTTPRSVIDPLPGKLARLNTHIAPDAGSDGYWQVRYYFDRGLSRIGADGEERYRVPLPPSDGPYEPFIVHQGRDGTVRVGTTHGLLRHIPGTRTLDVVPIALATNTHARPYVYGLLEDEAGSIWSALGKDGVVRISVAGEIELHVPLSAIAGDAWNGIMDVRPYDATHLLIGCAGRGLALLEKQTGSTTVIAGPLLPTSVYKGMNSALVLPDTSVLILRRNHGLAQVRKNRSGDWALENTWQLADRPNLQEACLDRHGRVWISSDKGGFLLDPRTDVLHRLDVLHGIAQAMTGPLRSTANGGVLAECGGWFQVDADHRPTKQTPLLMVRSVRVGNEALLADRFADGSLELPHDHNAMAITFGTVALLEGDAFTHAYRLSVDGVDGPWNDLGRQRSLNLLNLAPGTYRVDLRAEGPSSQPVDTALHFAILPPWWATWWARLGFIILAALIVVLGTRQVLATRYRQRLQKLEREREVERVRMRIARDIHDGIGSGLTKITILSRQLHASAGEQAERIAMASTDLVNELGEIVWTVDPRNDSYSSFVAFVRNTLGKQFDASTIELTSDLQYAVGDGERSIGPELKRNVLLVLKEAVNNAIKHSGATQVHVTLDLDRDPVRLQVTDNGHGFEPAQVRDGANGLLNFRKRAEAIGGQFELRTGPAGTTITLDVPLPSTNM